MLQAFRPNPYGMVALLVLDAIGVAIAFQLPAHDFEARARERGHTLGARERRNEYELSKDLALC
jgi:hypothetical protein